jgi:hypothetical protein
MMTFVVWLHSKKGKQSNTGAIRRMKPGNISWEISKAVHYPLAAGLLRECLPIDFANKRTQENLQEAVNLQNEIFFRVYPRQSL